MANARVTGIHADKGPDDPRIVKLAKLILILADKEESLETKFLCIKAAERFNIINEDEARQLRLYREELEKFMGDDDEDIPT